MPERNKVPRCRKAAKSKDQKPQGISVEFPNSHREGLKALHNARVTLHEWNKPTEEVGWLLQAMDKTE